MDFDGTDDVKVTYRLGYANVEKLEGTNLDDVFSIDGSAGSRFSPYCFIFSASEDRIIDEIRADWFESPVVGKKGGRLSATGRTATTLVTKGNVTRA